MKGKIIILSAPSGTGKSTIISHIIERAELRLGFSISATSRSPRGAERDGREYYFLTPDEFGRRVAAGDFVEWEEVYPGTCYGTLKSEVERVDGEGRNLIREIDVKG
ncbi:MAG: guanylate kinase, partial [Muribaculaceae bacterium]|nr:guanylate kinase [Muribaculaceae bacterium]